MFPPPMRYRPRGLGVFMGFAGETLYPDYWNDISIGICPSDNRSDGTLKNIQLGVEEDWAEQVQEVEPWDDSEEAAETAKACRSALLSIPVSYIYNAYATQTMPEWTDMVNMLANEVDQKRFQEGYQSWTAANLMLAGCPDWTYSTGESASRPGCAYNIVENDLTGGPSPRGLMGFDEEDVPGTYYRLKEGVERFFITDINNPASGSVGQSTIGVMWDSWGASATVGQPGGGTDTYAGEIVTNHLPGGSNALYMDGHVEFARYGSGYPCSALYKDLPNDEIILMSSNAGGFG